MPVASMMLSRRLYAGGPYAVRNGRGVSSHVLSLGDKDVVADFNGLFVCINVWSLYDEYCTCFGPSNILAASGFEFCL
jgi:hypothetical protein